jgi:hypothetical protein
MDDGWPQSRPYLLSALGLWASFLLTIALMAWGKQQAHFPAPALWGLALLPAGSVALQFALAYRLIARQDEYIRAIIAKRMIAATGLTITVAVLAGVAMQFLGVPLVPIWLVYPVFWGAFGIVTPFIRTSRL